MTAKEYLAQHGISEEIATLYNITSDDNYLNIPIQDVNGNNIFTKSRYLHHTKDSKEPKYKNSKNSKATLFNIDTIQEDKQIILCEGEIDTIRLAQEGIPAVSSTGGAGTFTEEFADQLADKQIIICYDNDQAGEQGIKHVLALIPTAKIIELPKGSKDICEYFTKYKAKDFFMLIKKSKTALEWRVKQLPEEHKLISGSELNQMEIVPMPWLIDGVVYQEGFCFVYGAEGIGKSFIALSMAQAIATGEPWMDKFNIPHTTNVLFLDMENPLSLTVKRTRGFGGAPDNIYWLKYASGFSLHDGQGGASEFAENVSDLVKANNIGLIVVDSFVDLMVGSANSAEDTQQFFRALRQLFPDVAFLVLHHENKPSQGVFRNSSQRLRGSSNINAQTFTMFRLEAVANSKTDLTLEQTKGRDEQKMDPFLFQMNVVPDPDRAGKTIVTGFSYIGVLENNEDTNKIVEAEFKIIQALQNISDVTLDRQSLISILEDGGMSESTFNRTIKNMENVKKIKKTKKGRAVWYTLTDPIVMEEEEPQTLF